MTKAKEALIDIDDTRLTPAQYLLVHHKTIREALELLDKVEIGGVKITKREMRNPVKNGGGTNSWYQNGFDVGYNQATDDIQDKYILIKREDVK